MVVIAENNIYQVFKEAVWTVNDMRTDNAFAEASADLRLNNHNDGADIFHSVQVRAGAPSDGQAPSPPTDFQIIQE